MKKDLTLILAFALIAGASSCVVGRKLSFENKEADPGFSTIKTAAVIFQDKRVDVLSGREKPSLCGYSKSTAQISFNIQTQSGKPLADEFAESVSTSYSKAGADAAAIFVNMNNTRDSIMQAFKTAGRDRLLYFTIHKWESRATPLFSTIHYEVVYQLELNVYNNNGELLASNSTEGIVEKKEGAATSMRKMQSMADDTFNEHVRYLFSSEAVKNSLL
jgi:hypothetical protein